MTLDFFWGAKRPWNFLAAGTFFDGAFDRAIDFAEPLVKELTSFPVESTELGEVSIVEILLGAGDIALLEGILDVLGARGLGFGFFRRDLEDYGI